MNARANHIVLHSLFSRELAHGIPAQAIDRFSQVRSTECKALFCFYISSVFACLMYEIIRLDVVCEIHANFALYITRLARKVLWARFLKRRFHPVIHHADRVPPIETSMPNKTFINVLCFGRASLSHFFLSCREQRRIFEN